MNRLSLGIALHWVLAGPLAAAPISRPAPTRLTLPSRIVDVSRDGTPLYNQMIAPPSALLAAPLHELKSAIAEAKPALVESVAQGFWQGPERGVMTLSDSCCGDAAPKLALLLQRAGLPIEVVEAEFHVYALWRHAAGDLIADPTIRQFFGKKQAPAAIPEIFAGSRADLHQLYKDHAASRTKTYEYHRIYFSDAETRNASVARLESELASREDLQTLARFLKRRRASMFTGF